MVLEKRGKKMDLVKMLDEEIISSMKEKNTIKLNTLRGVKASMKQQNIDYKKEINDELLIDVITREIKTRNESIKEFEKGNRQDLIDKTTVEIELLSKYLPAQLTDDEIMDIINKTFDELKPTGMKDMGSVMGKITPLLKGKADMSKVSSIIREKLI